MYVLFVDAPTTSPTSTLDAQIQPYTPRKWETARDRKEYLDYLRRSWLDGTIDSLHRTTRKLVKDSGGSALLMTYYEGSVAYMIMVEYADHAWMPWRFAKTPKSWWSDVSALFAKHDAVARCVVQLFLQDIGHQYGIEKLEDWNSVDTSKFTSTTTLHLADLGGLSFVLSQFLPQTVEEGKSHTRFELQRGETWDNPITRKRFWSVLLNQMGGDLKRFYSLSPSDIAEYGGGSILKYYNRSLLQALRTEFPSHDWKPWLFSRSPKQYWSSVAKRFLNGETKAVQIVKEYLSELATSLRLSKLSDWIYVRQNDLPHHQVLILRSFGGLPLALIVTYGKEVNWLAEAPLLWWKHVHNNYFSQKSTEYIRGAIRDALWKYATEYLGLILNIRELNDWYLVTTEQISKRDLSRLNIMGGLPAVLSIAFNSFIWMPWKFRCPPQGWSAEIGARFAANDLRAEIQVRNFLQELAAAHNVRRLEDWYRLSNAQIGAKTLYHLEALGRLPHLLQRLYPEHEWEEWRFSSSSKKAVQFSILRSLEKSLPDEKLIEEATPLSLNFAHLEGIDDVSSIKFDIAIPRLKVIVEYHGIHHFVPGVYGDVRIYQRRDAKKRELCKRNNWTFIEIPYSWDGNLQPILDLIRAKATEIR